MTEQSKSLPARSTLLGYPMTKTIKLNNGLSVSPVEEGKEAGARTTSCRLFGVDLISHHPSMPLVEKLPVQLSVSSGMPEGNAHSISSAAESDQKSDLSKGPKGNKLVELPLSDKDPQVKQSPVSARSRTKVRVEAICSCIF